MLVSAATNMMCEKFADEQNKNKMYFHVLNSIGFIINSKMNILLIKNDVKLNDLR